MIDILPILMGTIMPVVESYHANLDKQKCGVVSEVQTQQRRQFLPECA